MCTTSLDPDLNRINTFLRRKSCVFTPEWLHDCVEYYKLELGGADIADQLSSRVFEQWCLIDLSEFSIASLPAQLASHSKLKLTGSYALQVEKSVDISTSAFAQHQRLVRADTSNQEVDEERRAVGPSEPPARRMTRLRLTDGVQSVRAVEHRHVPLFNRTLVPGCKVLVTGPVLCRRGILLLCDGNIELLGGEVEALLVRNALENVLARKLGLPENPDPYQMQEANEIHDVALPTAADWGDDVWEQDLVSQLPEILTAAGCRRPGNRVREACDGGVSDASSGRENVAAGTQRPALGTDLEYDRGTSSSSNHGYPQDLDDWNPPPNPAEFSLSDSEDELLQAVDVEAAVRMTQMQRPIRDESQMQRPISDQPQMQWPIREESQLARPWDSEPGRLERGRQQREHLLEEDELEMREFQPQTCFPRRREDFPTEERFPRQPPRSRHEALAELRAQRQRRSSQPAQGGAVGLRGNNSVGDRGNDSVGDRGNEHDTVGHRGNDGNPVGHRGNDSVGDRGVEHDTVGHRGNNGNPVGHRSNDSVGDRGNEHDTVGHRGNDGNPVGHRGNNSVGDRGNDSVGHCGNERRPAADWAESGDEGAWLMKRVKISPEPRRSEPLRVEPRGPETTGSLPAEAAAEPFVYLDAVGVGRSVVKASVLQLRSGLKVADGRWHLAAEIADGSGNTLDVDFANNVLEELTGYTVRELCELKKQMAANPLLKERVTEELRQARLRLMELNCLMTLEAANDCPVQVVGLTEMKESHRALLVDRISTVARHK